MSIWDGFKGVPPPRPRKSASSRTSAAPATANPAPTPAPAPQPAPQPAPEPTPTNATVTATNPPTTSATTTSGNGNTTAITKQGEDQAHSFTTADDAKLLELKAAGKTWKEIVAEMKKSQSALKERFKEIGPKASGGAANATTVTKQGEDEAHTFTVADDAKLIEMKAAGKTWKDIVAETKKSMSALRERFKEIGPKADGAAGAGAGVGAAEGDDKKKKKKEESGAKAAAADDAKKKTEEEKSQKKTTVCKHCGKDASAPVEKEANPPPTKAQITVAGLADDYDLGKWRYVASRYYDLTGERVSAEWARKEAKAGKLFLQ
ncbi:hypothetical protein GJ744_009486 [Endocarpon pusillum]|uniref:Myb-like domain-containing protein n=1 Tax=Endocarpon pusillum TaxID=364733 RepID=A0A8H7AIT9_9EURO|nr:hypothetical protein GJ744_009486 [Endocarpon pusillum]